MPEKDIFGVKEIVIAYHNVIVIVKAQRKILTET